MAGALFPDARFRSPTAVQNRSDVRDEMVYSALRLGDGAVGQTKTFTIPQGQTIPSLGNAGGLASWQTTHSALTTNLTKAGEFGSALGDASVRGIGITVEAAIPLTANASLTTVYPVTGGTPQDVLAVLAQASFALRIGGKKQIEQPVWAFPALGGPKGSLQLVSGAAGGATVITTGGFVTNGEPGTGRKLKIPVLIARTDTVEGEFNIAGTLDMFGSNTQSMLVWTGLLALIKGDVR